MAGRKAAGAEREKGCQRPGSTEPGAAHRAGAAQLGFWRRKPCQALAKRLERRGMARKGALPSKPCRRSK